MEGQTDQIVHTLTLSWERLSQDSFSEFVDAGALLNEFAMMWALRERFPLHFIVFKQTACHLSREANVEQVRVFSRAGKLSDPNVDPEFLAHLVMVLINKKSYRHHGRCEGQVLRALLLPRR